MLSKFIKWFPPALSNYPILICILQSRVVKGIPRVESSYFWAERSCNVSSNPFLLQIRILRFRGELTWLSFTQATHRAGLFPRTPTCLKVSKSCRPQQASTFLHVSIRSNLDVTSSMHLKCKSTLIGQEIIKADYSSAIQYLKDLGIL